MKKLLLAWPLTLLTLPFLVGLIPNAMAVTLLWAKNTIRGENEEFYQEREVPIMRTGIFIVLFVVVVVLLAVK